MRVVDIDDFGDFEVSNLRFISEDIFNILKRYTIRPGDLFISIAGTVGKVGVVENVLPSNVVLTENCAKLQIKDSTIIPYYLKCVLNTNILQRQIQNHFIQTTIAKLGLERIENLRIPPIPSIAIQRKVINLIKEALKQRDQKEVDARDLLASIDGYVLAQLGIASPSAQDNSLRSRMFYTTANNLAGWRFDAPAHSAKPFLQSTTHQMVRLKEYAAINPYTSLAVLRPETSVTFIPMEAISDEYGEIQAEQTREIGESKGYTTFREGDILWAKITPCMQNGKSVVANNLLNNCGFGSTEYHVFRTQADKLNNHYLHALLRLKTLRQEATNFFSGTGGQQRVDTVFFHRLSIPLPPLEKQKEIVEQVLALIKQAKQLRAEGQSIIERAKQEVEAVILGAA